VSQFDREIVLFLNQFAQRSWTFDQLVTLIATTDVIKGGIVASFLWAWFKTGPEQQDQRSVAAGRMRGGCCPLPPHPAPPCCPLADPAIAFLRPATNHLNMTLQ
jgi:hypothetical protein